MTEGGFGAPPLIAQSLLSGRGDLAERQVASPPTNAGVGSTTPALVHESRRPTRIGVARLVACDRRARVA